MDYYSTPSYYFDDLSHIDNVTYDIQEPEPMSLEFIITIAVGVLIALFNGILICGIILNRDLRDQPKYLLILILCCVDFVTGAFSLPGFVVSSEIIFRHKPDDYCPMFLLYIIEITAIYESTTGILMVCIIVINWIVMVTVKAYNTVDRKKLVIAMTSFAHVGAFVMAMVCVLAFVVDIPDYCIVRYVLEFPIALVSETPPLVFLVITTIFLLVSYYQQKKLIAVLAFPVDLIVASIITILCVSPHNISAFVTYAIPTYFFLLSYLGNIILLRLATLRCVILPFVWLLDRHFRAELKRSLTCKAQCRKSSTSIEMQERP